MYTTQTCIYARNGWRVTSYGRGAAFLIEQGPMSTFVQGDDAALFDAELDTALEYDCVDRMLEEYEVCLVPSEEE